jgi:hypothetical protein
MRLVGTIETSARSDAISMFFITPTNSYVADS